MSQQSEEMQIGEDSFLDTIANLVGILIILVAVVGARGYTSAKAEAHDKIKNEFEKLEAPANRAKQIEDDLRKQQAQLRQYEIEIAYRDSERMAVMDRVTVAKQVVEEELDSVDSATRDEVKTDQEVSDLQKQLADLLKQQGDVQGQQPNTVVLQHLPTPMAKTVFGQEVHVMMQQGMVTIIPWDSLVETLKTEARRSAERNSQKERFINRLGPIDGFVMVYELKSQSGIMSNGSAARLGRMVELEKFELEPTDAINRESVSQTLSTGGRLRLELASCTPQHTTITVWVYPDSFTQFRELKEKLFTEGFLCAARPLPLDVRIGASPKGSASAAQ